MLQDTQEELHCYNSYVQSIYATIELTATQHLQIIILADKNAKPKDARSRTFNLPHPSEVAAIMPGAASEKYDVLVDCRQGGLKRISQLHQSYDPIHSVILFPFSSDGWHGGIKRSDGHTLTASNYYVYRLQVQKDDFNTIMKSQRLM